MTRLEQRGAVAFTCMGRRGGGDPAIHRLGIFVLENHAHVLAWMRFQPKLFHLLADLIFVPAKDRGLCDSPAVGDFVRQVPGYPFRTTAHPSSRPQEARQGGIAAHTIAHLA